MTQYSVTRGVYGNLFVESGKRPSSEMVGDTVQVTVNLERSNVYHREVLKILQSQNPVETREYIVSAILNFSRSPSYQLQSGIEQGITSLQELISRTTEAMKLYTKYMQDLVETVEKNVGQTPVPVPVLEKIIEQQMSRFGNTDYDLSETVEQVKLIYGILKDRMPNIMDGIEHVIDTGTKGRQEEGFGKVKDDGMGSTFKNLAEEFGG